MVTGSFADEGIVAGDAANYSDFVFDPTGPVTAIWSIGTFTFDLTTMVVEFQSASLLALSGSGFITSTDTNLDKIFGLWTFTANETGQNLTWSSGSAVPEPAVISYWFNWFWFYS